MINSILNLSIKLISVDPLDLQTYLSIEYCEQYEIHEEIRNSGDRENAKDKAEIINTEYSNIEEKKKGKITIKLVKRPIEVIMDFLEEKEMDEGDFKLYKAPINMFEKTRGVRGKEAKTLFDFKFKKKKQSIFLKFLSIFPPFRGLKIEKFERNYCMGI